MNTDIRLSVSFWNHPKTIKLARKLGLEAVRSLQILWLYTAQNRPKGVLDHMDIEDIEISADWDGEPGTLVKALVDIGWIDFVEPNYIMHGWEEHQQFACYAPERSEQAKKAIAARWDRERQKKSHANTGSNTPVNIEKNTENAGSNTDSIRTVLLNDTDSNTPLPIPSPIPEEEYAYAYLSPGDPATPAAQSEIEPEDIQKPQAPPCPHGKIVELWHEILPELPRVKAWNGQRERHLTARWRERWKAGKFKTQAEGVEYFRSFFGFVRKSSFLMGQTQNRDGRSFHASLPWLVTSEKFLRTIEGEYHERE